MIIVGIFKNGFRVKSVNDIETFLNGICKGAELILKINQSERIVIEKDNNGVVHIYTNKGEQNPFNPLVYVTSTEKEKDYVLSYLYTKRKLINDYLKGIEKR